MVDPGRDDARLPRLVDAIQDFAIVGLARDGTILSWNAGAEQLTGYAAADMLGSNFDRLFTADQRAVDYPRTLLADVQTTGRFEDEFWQVRQDGTLFWAELVVNTVRDSVGGELAFVAITRDRTASHVAEQAMRQSEQSFRLLVANLREYAVFLLSPEGTVATWNAGAERLKGYRASEIIGQHFERFYTPEDRAAGRAAALLARARAEGDAKAEGWRVRKDGTRFWADVVITALYDDQGRVRGYAKVTRDTTERRQAEEHRVMRLAAERVVDRLARLQNVTAALAAAGRPEEVATLLGSAGIAAIGAAAGAVALPVPGEDALEVAHVSGFGEGSVQLHQRIWRTDPYTLAEAWRTNEPLFISTREQLRQEHPYLMPLAERSRYEAWASVPLIIERRVVGVLTLSFAEPHAFDADERGFMLALGEVAAQALERAELFGSEQRARAEAEAAVRAQDEFLSIASHELRTPVAAVKATAQLAQRAIQRGTYDVARFQHNLEVITRAADRLAGLVEDLLDVSRLRTGRLRLRQDYQDIRPLLQEIVERYRAHNSRPNAGRGHQFDLRLPIEPVVLYVDASRLEQVLDNFLSNALKYTPHGGLISVSVDVEDDATLISVVDPGIGLPSGQEERIFEPFGRASNAAEQQIPGLGLGLAICRQLIEAHGGRVWASSPGEQQGTSFMIRLPRTAQPVRQASA